MRSLGRSASVLWRSPTFTSWASLGIRIGGLALLLPLVLTRLDTPEVLVWQMLATIVAMVGWMDFGFSATFGRIIASARGGGSLGALEAAMPVEARIGLAQAEADRPIAIEAVLATQRAVYRRLVILASLVGGLLGTAALARPVAALGDPAAGWGAWAITAAAALLTLLNIGNASIVTGHDRIADMRRIEAFVGAGQLLSTSLVVLLGGGLVAIVGCYSAWTGLLFLLNARLARRVAPGLKDAGGTADPLLLRLIWPAAWRSGLGILMSTGIIQGSGLVYAQFAAPAAAASYLLALRLVTTLSPIAQVPFYTKLPMLAKLRAERREHELAALAMRGMLLSHWTYVAGALAILIVAPPLLDAIDSSVRLPGFGLMALLLLAFFAERYGAMHIQLYSLTNHIVWHIANGVTGALMIVLCLALWPALGAAAMPTAMLAAYAGFFIWYTSRLSFRSLGVARAAFERRTMLGPALVLALGTAAAGLA